MVTIATYHQHHLIKINTPGIQDVLYIYIYIYITVYIHIYNLDNVIIAGLTHCIIPFSIHIIKKIKKKKDIIFYMY